MQMINRNDAGLFQLLADYHADPDAFLAQWHSPDAFRELMQGYGLSGDALTELVQEDLPALTQRAIALGRMTHIELQQRKSGAHVLYAGDRPYLREVRVNEGVVAAEVVTSLPEGEDLYLWWSDADGPHRTTTPSQMTAVRDGVFAIETPVPSELAGGGVRLHVARATCPELAQHAACRDDFPLMLAATA